jgi:hypothetical protein
METDRADGVSRSVRHTLLDGDLRENLRISSEAEMRLFFLS